VPGRYDSTVFIVCDSRRHRRSQSRNVSIASRWSCSDGPRVLSRDNPNPHSRTFSITHRVRRRRQRLPSSLVIENPRRSTSGFYLNMARLGFPMNANDKPAKWSVKPHCSVETCHVPHRCPSSERPSGMATAANPIRLKILVCVGNLLGVVIASFINRRKRQLFLRPAGQLARSADRFEPLCTPAGQILPRNAFDIVCN
jgi:hypothetical protein